MEEIKVGDFIRSNDGYIGKITRISQNSKRECDTYYSCDNCIASGFYEQIKKHSKNIINLIEVGDIVHIKDVLHEDITHIWSEDYLKALKEDLSNGIKLVEILTHEQYEQNCYKV